MPGSPQLLYLTLSLPVLYRISYPEKRRHHAITNLPGPSHLLLLGLIHATRRVKALGTRS
jgi:hypothetical protein